LRSRERWIERDRRRLNRLEAALQHTDAGVRRDTVIELGKSGGGRAMRLLLNALRDPDPRIRVAAAEGLAGVGTRQAIVPLCCAVLDPDASVARSAAGALGVLISHPHTEVRQERQARVVRALADCIQKYSTAQLRARLSLLRGVLVPGVPLGGSSKEEGRELLARLEEQMSALEDLPLPAGAPPPSTRQLPIPAPAPPLDPDSLPLPSSAPAP
jgi:hypothetical protein